MNERFLLAVSRVLEFEGGYSNDPQDSGGETVFGCTRRDDKEVRWDIVDMYKHQTSDRREFGQLYKLMKADDVLMDSIYNTYKVHYWDKVRGDYIVDDNVVFNIFDCGVNMGTSRAIKMAQQVLGITVDGIIGNNTITSINNSNPQDFIDRYKEIRINKYISIVNNNPSQEVFLNGWINRVNQC